jgi:hypothetical protein
MTQLTIFGTYANAMGDVYHPPLPENMTRWCGECKEFVPWDSINATSGMCTTCHEENCDKCDDCGQDTRLDELEADDEVGDTVCKSCMHERRKCDECGRDAGTDYKYDDDGNRLCTECQTNTLHVDGDEVVSDEGSTAPLQDVVKSAPHLLYLMEQGRRWRPDTNLMWGDYKVNYIDTNGRLHVGCHTFRLDWFKRFCRNKLGIVPQTPKNR